MNENYSIIQKHRKKHGKSKDTVYQLLISNRISHLSKETNQIKNKLVAHDKLVKCKCDSKYIRIVYPNFACNSDEELDKKIIQLKDAIYVLQTKIIYTKITTHSRPKIRGMIEMLNLKQIDLYCLKQYIKYKCK